MIIVDDVVIETTGKVFTVVGMSGNDILIKSGNITHWVSRKKIIKIHGKYYVSKR